MQKSNLLEDANARSDISRAEIARCNTELSCLQKDCESANQRNSFLLETQRQLLRQKEVEGGRAKDFKNTMKFAEQKYAGLSGELICLGRELDAVHGSNDELAEINNGLKQELYALQNHADLLALQNADLQKELDEFVLTDDIIRNGLDRKGRVY